MTKNEQKYINSLIEENNRVKTLLVRFMSALVKVQTVEEIERISLIPIMLEENKKFRAEIKAEAYKECIEMVKEKSCKLNMCHNDVVVKIDYQISGENLNNLLKELIGE